MTIHEQEQRQTLSASCLDRHQAESQNRSDERLEHRLTVRRVKLQHALERRFWDARLGYPDVHAARARYGHLHRVIDADVEAGATRHGRLSWLVRQIPRLVAVIDCVVLYTFCGFIFNVPLDDPLQDPLPALAAALLSVLASGVSYTWLSVTGDRLKTYRGELGEVLWRLVGATTWFMVAASVVLVTVLAMLMYARVSGEVRNAADVAMTGTARPLGVIFAVISAIANLSVVAVHALDGSPQADEQRHVGRLLRRHEKAVHRHRLAVVKAAGRIRGLRSQPDDGREFQRPADEREPYRRPA